MDFLTGFRDIHARMPDRIEWTVIGNATGVCAASREIVFLPEKDDSHVIVLRISPLIYADLSLISGLPTDEWSQKVKMSGTMLPRARRPVEHARMRIATLSMPDD
jgi:hypothetical protein